MTPEPDFVKLIAALSDSIAEVPLKVCDHEDEKVRRECRETALVRVQARERVEAYRALWVAMSG